MARTAEINQLILKNIRLLTDKEKREVLNYIEYLRIKEDRSFVDYVILRTKEAVEAKKSGQRFTSLDELKGEYA